MKFFWSGLVMIAVLVGALFVVFGNEVLMACGGSENFTISKYSCQDNGCSIYGCSYTCIKSDSTSNYSCTNISGQGCGYYPKYTGSDGCTSDSNGCNYSSTVGSFHSSTCGGSGGGGPAPTSPPSGGGGSSVCAQQGGFCQSSDLSCPSGYWSPGYACPSGQKCCYRAPDANAGRCSILSWYLNDQVPPVDLSDRNISISYLCDAFYGNNPSWPQVTLFGGRYHWKCYGSDGSSVDCSENACTPSNGACGSSNGGTFGSPPGNNCSAGSLAWTDSNGNDGYYDWNCNGNSCGSGASCRARKNSPPNFSSMVLRNASLGVVTAEGENQNQICDTSRFGGSRTINVTINASDPDGAGDINNIRLMWNNIEFTRTSLANGVAAFVHTFTAGENSPRANVFYTRIYDNVGHDTNWVATGRALKIWDCNVAVSGSGYDGSSSGGVCSDANSFVTKISGGKDYSLLMNDVTSDDSSYDKTMTVSSPNYSSGSNLLTWGRDYVFTISNLEGVVPSQIRINGNTCSNIQFNLNNSTANPYASPVSSIIDFTSVIDQDPWWQAVNGGAMSNISINDRVPVTCTTTNCVVSNGGLVSAPVINNTGKTSGYQSWSYIGSLANSNTNYSYFYNQYFVKGGIGTTSVGKTISSVTDLGLDTNGVYFINGDLSINGDITTNNFLMVIVNGNITVDSAVNVVDGILVANNISASGNSGTPLVFNGSLYAADGVNFSRGYTLKSHNNDSPAVVVNYNPQLIFNLPSRIVKVLTNWQWGN